MSDQPQKEHLEWLWNAIYGVLGLGAIMGAFFRKNMGFALPKEREARDSYREKMDEMEEDVKKIGKAIAPIGPALEHLAHAIERLCEVSERAEDRTIKKLDNVVDAQQRLAARVGDLISTVKSAGANGSA